MNGFWHNAAICLYSGDLKSEPFEIRKNSKSGLFKGQISNGLVFKWSGYSYTQPCDNQTAQNPDFFVRISNGWASRFHIPFENWTIFNPTSYWLLEIHISPNFRNSPYTYRARNKSYIESMESLKFDSNRRQIICQKLKDFRL